MTKKHNPEYADLPPNTLGCLVIYSALATLIWFGIGLLCRLVGG